MPSSIYDTHSGVRRLTEAGMPATQAEAVIGEHVQLMANHLASKDDFVGLQRELQEGNESLRREMQAALEALRSDLQGQITALRHEFQLHREEERTREYRMVAEIAGVVATLLGVFAAVMKFL